MVQHLSVHLLNIFYDSNDACPENNVNEVEILLNNRSNQGRMLHKKKLDVLA